jgi:hypothetical protein
MEDATTELGWYVSDIHCRRAIGYLSAKLAEEGYLPADFQSPLLLKMWGEALQETMNVGEPSPIGPEPELARKFLLATIEQRIEQIEDRNDRIETAIMKISKAVIAVDYKGIEKILYGTETTPKTGPGPA